ncbi:hypothetical protein [Paucisalibacillus globulus]|uniref:hypothetical protein n=1 Tax=Paucisalibacillus globulus TaxID=351095 RepID=UPI000BB82FA5|nr:hypothetical protein [Paucisalibacillus globulus]
MLNASLFFVLWSVIGFLAICYLLGHLEHVPEISGHAPKVVEDVPKISEHVPNMAEDVPKTPEHAPNMAEDVPGTS